MSSITDLVEKYFTAKRHLQEAFTYHPDWVEIPMDDQTDMHWMLIGGNAEGGDGAYCIYYEKPLTVDVVGDGAFYGGPAYVRHVYTQRFLPKWVYRTPTHVMISVDTQTDGNKFLMIFDAAKECKDEKVAQAFNKCREKWDAEYKAMREREPGPKTVQERRYG